MSRYTSEYLDIMPFMQQQMLPERILPRGENDVWVIRKQPVDFTHTRPMPQDYAIVQLGDLLRIPLIPYRTNSTQPHEALLAAMDMIQRCIRDQPKVVRTHLIIGTPVEDLRPAVDALRFWVGVAFQVR